MTDHPDDDDALADALLQAYLAAEIASEVAEIHRIAQRDGIPPEWVETVLAKIRGEDARAFVDGYDAALADIEAHYPVLARRPASRAFGASTQDNGSCRHGERYDQCPTCSPPEPPDAATPSPPPQEKPA